MTELETYEDVTPGVEQALREASARMPEFAREDTRERLVEYARATSATRWSRVVFSRIAAVAIGCSVAGGGLAQAAASALPGEPLYPAKRVVESAKLAVASSSEAVQHLLGEIAGERAEELTELVYAGADDEVVDAAAESFIRSAERYGGAPGHAEQLVRKATEDKPEAVRRRVEREVDEHSAGKGAAKSSEESSGSGKDSGKSSGSGKSKGEGARKGGGKP